MQARTLVSNFDRRPWLLLAGMMLLSLTGCCRWAARHCGGPCGVSCAPPVCAPEIYCPPPVPVCPPVTMCQPAMPYCDPCEAACAPCSPCGGFWDSLGYESRLYRCRNSRLSWKLFCRRCRRLGRRCGCAAGATTAYGMPDVSVMPFDPNMGAMPMSAGFGNSGCASCNQSSNYVPPMDGSFGPTMMTPTPDTVPMFTPTNPGTGGNPMPPMNIPGRPMLP